MGSSIATAARRTGRGRTAARRRAAIRRRRRWLYATASAVGLIVLVILALPVAKRAINDLGLPLQYQDIIRQQAAAKHLPADLIAAVIYAETKFDPRTSPTGAEGVMQIEPATAEFLARRSGATTFHVSDLNTPQVNIAYGSYYLRYLLDVYHQKLVPALAAYNGGMGNVDRWLNAAQARGVPFTISDIPFPETQAYVQRVMQVRGEYRRTYARQLGLQ
jgi:soluble lytic murein transglycosylase